MNNQSQSRLASLLTIGVGVWLMASPLFISVSGAALVNVLIVGGIIAVAGAVQLFWNNTLPSWIAAITAVWLMVSAFMFNAGTGFVWSAILSAVAAFALAVWDGIEVDHVQHTGHQAAV
jgi:hypothetical protein